MAEKVSLLLVLAILVEALTEYVKNLIHARDRNGIITQACAMAFGILLCVGSGADLFGMLGIPFRIPMIGCVLTGIFASRGANYVSDLITQIQGKVIRKETEHE